MIYINIYTNTLVPSNCTLKDAHDTLKIGNIQLVYET